MSDSPRLHIRGAHAHNFAGIDLDLPHDRLVVITGVSGSGKSSLAFDTIFREGERRYVRTFSPHARRRLARRGPTEVDGMEGVRPAVAIDQRRLVANPRSTVGTLSEIGDELRLLFARFGARTCPDCGRAVEDDDRSRRDPVACACGRPLGPLRRSMLSFNTEEGACPRCRGLGVEERVDPRLLIADTSKSLRDGALVPTRPNGYIVYSQVTPDALDTVCRAHGFDIDTPFEDLDDEQRRVVFWGSDRVEVPFGKHSLESRMKWTGIKAKPRETGYYRGVARVIEETLQRSRNDNVLRFVASVTCSACDGVRLGPDALAVRLGDASIVDWTASRVSDVQGRVASARAALAGDRLEAAAVVLGRIAERTAELTSLGLGHLALDRPAGSLSSGEARRLRLAIQLGIDLAGVSYVIDEPTAGTHPSERAELVRRACLLRDRGNSVFVVEHDPRFRAAADHIVEIGPGAGRDGGTLVEQPSAVPMPISHAPRPGAGDLVVRGIRARAFDGADVAFRLGALNVVTGISGSGKTTLVDAVLGRALARRLHGAREPALEHDGIDGAEGLRKVVVVTQREIGRSPRSNPATYSGAWDRIRDLFAATESAADKGLKKGRFSFNQKGGRCETCEGAGVERIGLMSLPAVETTCRTCAGRRFTEDVLSVTVGERNIRDVLEMSVTEAVRHFADDRTLRRILGAIERAGLGYLALGQPATTLSGGEAQRLKLASELARADGAGTLIILDEPTTGLDPANVDVLVDALDALIADGATVVAAEHEPRFILRADRVIDLGPGAGPDGGRVVASGTPEEIAAAEGSATGRFLAADASGGASPIPASGGRRDAISLRGVTTRNLRGVDVEFPRDALTVVTGVSGSGKTSLAFDTLAAEGLRRFGESFSPGLRRELRAVRAGSLEGADGLGPTVAVRARRRANDPRSTVGTVTTIDGALRLLFSRAGRGETDDASSLSASAFSFNDVAGACSECDGRGTTKTCDVDRLIVDPERSLDEGVLAATKAGRFLFEVEGRHHAVLQAMANALAIPLGAPWRDLDTTARRAVVDGVGERLFQVDWRHAADKGEGAHLFSATWDGVAVLVETEYEKKRERKLGPAFAELLVDSSCPTCAGERISPAARRRRVGPHRLPELRSMEVDDLVEALAAADRWGLPADGAAVASRVRDEVTPRLERLRALGLGHLTLDRGTSTLSTGERRRLEIAAQLVDGLRDVAYVLDEPTLGLHASDRKGLVAALRALIDAGNAVVVVEHDESIIRAADHIIETGVGAGVSGGNVIAAGRPSDLDGACLTSKLLSGALKLRRETTGNGEAGPRIVGAGLRNLRDVDVELRYGEMTAVVGVSGSGKSTLLLEVIAPTLAAGRAVGAKALESAVGPVPSLVARGRPFGGGPAQIVATALDVMKALRDSFARAPAAKEAGLRAAAFGFGSRAGRCPVCLGTGERRIALDFLPDVAAACRACDGTRFAPEVLAVRLEGLNIAEVLALDASSLAGFDAAPVPLRRAAELLGEIGLEHVAFGRRVDGLSGGEARRLGLAHELLSGPSAETEAEIFLFDEPSRGLHAADRTRLLRLFERLTGAGHAVVFTEHALDLISVADRVLELGPGPGRHGGALIFEGTPSDLRRADTPTGDAMRESGV